jgi:hypothetical protein
MTAIFVAVVLVVIAILAFAFIGWIALFPLLVAVGILVWAARTMAAGRSPTGPIHETGHAELLGPGGPDDPDQGRR